MRSILIPTKQNASVTYSNVKRGRIRQNICENAFEEKLPF